GTRYLLAKNSQEEPSCLVKPGCVGGSRASTARTMKIVVRVGREHLPSGMKHIDLPCEILDRDGASSMSVEHSENVERDEILGNWWKRPSLITDDQLSSLVIPLKDCLRGGADEVGSALGPRVGLCARANVNLLQKRDCAKQFEIRLRFRGERIANPPRDRVLGFELLGKEDPASLSPVNDVDFWIQAPLVAFGVVGVARGRHLV